MTVFIAIVGGLSFRAFIYLAVLFGLLKKQIRINKLVFIKLSYCC